MKAFVCLAISCLLVGLLYVYVRQQLAAQNNQIGELSRFIRGMAAEVIPEKELKVVKEEYPSFVPPDEKQLLIEVSDDSDSDSDTESDTSEVAERPKLDVLRTVDISILESPKLTALPDLVPDLLPELIEPDIEVVEETAKKIVLEANYEQWSLKELKEKITQMGGPNLKTKKLMIEYLEKKV